MTYGAQQPGARLRARIVLVVAVIVAAPARALGDETIQFNRDIRPLLSDNCFGCHGPDQAQRQADLRLDVEESAKRELDGVRPIVPGDLEASELYRRITSSDEDERMPPPDSGKTLSPEQIEKITRWIRTGARWQEHWAFIAPLRPAIPPLQKSNWVRNPIDAFVLARLEAEGLAPSAEADKTTLIRRVTLDLTGLRRRPRRSRLFWPTTRRRRTSARSIGCWLRLATASEWRLRLARMQPATPTPTATRTDAASAHMWRWRDWVIDAFNRNMPFDQFTIEQLAGDMLPNATLDQRHRHRLQPQPPLPTRRAASSPRSTCGGIRRRPRGYDDPPSGSGSRWAAPVATITSTTRSRSASSTSCSHTSTTCRSGPRAVKFGNSPPFVKAARPSPSSSLRLDELQNWPIDMKSVRPHASEIDEFESRTEIAAFTQ